MENFFQPWNADHKIYMLAMLGSWVLVPFIFRKYLNDNWQRRAALCLVISILGVEIIDDIYRVFDSKGWFASSDLPLHMCGFSVFTTSWALLTKDQLIFELSYFWGFGGAIQAILTPDPSGILNHFYLFTFMVSHGLIILNVFYLIFVYGMVLKKGALLRTIIITNILLVGIAIINWLLDANYFYLFRPPPVESPLILAREFPLYFINMEFVAIIVLYIISIPMLIHRRKIEN